MKALYVIGEPGAGKSTLIQALTDGHPCETTDSPFPMRRYDCGPLELGKRRDDFSGTDALAMNIQPKVQQFIEGVRPALLLAEGDRLGNAAFFAFLRSVGYDLRIVYLDAEGVAVERRIARGSSQNEAWLRGRATKVKRLAMTEPDVLWLDARLPIDALIGLLAHDPVASAFLADAAIAA